METSQSADVALLALLELEQHGNRTAQDFAAALDISRTSAARILATLRERGFAVRNLDGSFSLGPQLITSAARVRPEIAIAADPHIQELADRLGETAVLSVLDQSESVVAAQQVGGRNALRVEHEIGARQLLSRGASGLAILASLPTNDPRVLTSATTPDSLAAIRQEGFALSQGEVREGMTGVAVPVRGLADTVVASIAIVVPSERADELSSSVPLLRESAEVVRSAYRSLRESASTREGVERERDIQDRR